jgi:hypothetical protein
MSRIRDGFIIIIIFGILFLTIDYFFGKYILGERYYQKNLGNLVQLAGTTHDIYHHDLKKNLSQVQYWGNLTHKLCTNSFGFKSSCDNIINKKYYDIVFIGDSFTEGIGLAYEDTFVGLFADSYPELSVANMGVASYSPAIYRSKIQYYLETAKMKFNHVFVFIDISDIQDEAFSYERLIDNRVVTQAQAQQGQSPEDSVTGRIKQYLYDKTPVFHLLLKTLYRLNDKNTGGLENGLAMAAEWTYNPQSKGFGNKGIQFGIDNAIHHMEELHKMLQERNIKLSIGIYPWPNQLKYDVVNNKQAKIWRDFCVEKCSYFINTMPAFFKYLQSNGEVKTYQDLYFYGDVHFNNNGNRIVFEEIKKNFQKI